MGGRTLPRRCPEDPSLRRSPDPDRPPEDVPDVTSNSLVPTATDDRTPSPRSDLGPGSSTGDSGMGGRTPYLEVHTCVLTSPNRSSKSL